MSEGGGLLTAAVVIKWELERDLWGVALEFANGDKQNYFVGSYDEAVTERLKVLKQFQGLQAALAS